MVEESETPPVAAFVSSKKMSTASKEPITWDSLEGREVPSGEASISKARFSKAVHSSVPESIPAPEPEGEPEEEPEGELEQEPAVQQAVHDQPAQIGIPATIWRQSIFEIARETNMRNKAREAVVSHEEIHSLDRLSSPEQAREEFQAQAVMVTPHKFDDRIEAPAFVEIPETLEKQKSKKTTRKSLSKLSKTASAVKKGRAPSAQTTKAPEKTRASPNDLTYTVPMPRDDIREEETIVSRKGKKANSRSSLSGKNWPVYVACLT